MNDQDKTTTGDAARAAMATATDSHATEKSADKTVAVDTKTVVEKPAEVDKKTTDVSEVQIVRPFMLTLDGGGTRFFNVGDRVDGDLANHFYVRAHSDHPLPPPEAAPGTPGWAMMQATNRRRMDDLRRMQEAQALVESTEGQAIAARRAVQTLGGKI